MATGPTTSANVIKPDVFADALQAYFVGNTTVFRQLVREYDTLVGQPGETVHLPNFLPLSDAEEVAETDALTPEILTQAEKTVTIKEVGKLVEITDKALLTAVGDPLEEARRQIVRVVNRKINKDIYDELVSYAEGNSKVLGDQNTDISYSIIADALGEEEDYEDAVNNGFVLVIHPKLKAKLYKDPNFIDASKYGSPVLQTGEIGQIYGIPVVVSSIVEKVVVDASAGTYYYKNLLVRRGVVGLIYKRRPQVETFRDIAARTTMISCTVHYAVGPVATYPDGAIEIRCK
ncbi:N4-gp56 family major capsid protein [Thermovibrio ammonificans]